MLGALFGLWVLQLQRPDEKLLGAMCGQVVGHLEAWPLPTLAIFCKMMEGAPPLLAAPPK